MDGYHENLKVIHQEILKEDVDDMIFIKESASYNGILEMYTYLSVFPSFVSNALASPS